MVHDISQQGYSAKEVYRLLGVNKNQLFHWISTHRLLRPDIDEGGGRGKKRVLSRNNLLELTLIIQLLQYKIDLKLIKQIKAGMDEWERFAINKNGKWIEADIPRQKGSKRFDLYEWAFETGEEARFMLALEEGSYRLALIEDLPYVSKKVPVILPPTYIAIDVKKLAGLVMGLIKKA
ncbi:MAG: MerR family transcriptional regulator [Anaerolineales bacterium]|nr:MAG: MerR family transcriptional regulator [Anaerolineales bacterium]